MLSLKLRDYQIEAINNWFDNGNFGIFEMATGTGKTFTALSAFKRLSDEYDKFLTVIACPQLHLINQWINDIKKFHDSDIIVFSSSNNNRFKDLKALWADFSLGLVDKAVIITTHLSLSHNELMNFVNDFKYKSLLIVDEVHGIGSSKQMRGLNDNFDYRLGLSATPERWFDEEGSQILFDYFRGSVFKFDIQDALETINPDTGETYLTPYYYHPVIVDLNNDEMNEFIEITKQLAYYLNSKRSDAEDKAETLKLKRQRIINNLEDKLVKFEEILKKHPDLDKTIIFCSPQQIDDVQVILNNQRISQHKFTQSESANKTKKQLLSQREQIIKQFEDGAYRVLVAIKCLDEGVDIPIADTAIIMSSTSNPREYVQRRGRILRRAPGKKFATIYDMIVFPKRKTEYTSKISDKEVDRYREFAQNAINSYECLQILDKYYYR